MWSSSVVEAALSGLKIEIFIQDPKCVNKLEYKGKAKIPGDMTDRGTGILCRFQIWEIFRSLDDFLEWYK